jgi:hypothetical protein
MIDLESQSKNDAAPRVGSSRQADVGDNVLYFAWQSLRVRSANIESKAMTAPSTLFAVNGR